MHMKTSKYILLVCLMTAAFSLSSQECDITKCTPEQIAKCCPPSCDIETATAEEIAKCCPWMADDFDMEAFKAKCASMTEEEKAACKIECGMKGRKFKKKRGGHHDAFFMKHAGKNKGHLGVLFQDESPDNIISEVTLGTAAEQYKLEVGDQIISINGTPTKNYESIANIMRSQKAGDEVEFVILRNGQEETKLIPLRKKRDYGNVDWTLRSVRSCEPKTKTEQRTQIESKVGLNALVLDDFNAFPNPANDFIQLNFEGEAIPTGISVIDISGRIIHRESISNFSGTYSKQINVENADGMVVISVSQKQKVYTQKIIVVDK